MSQTSVTYSPRSRQCAYEDIVPVLELLMGREKYGNKYSNVEQAHRERKNNCAKRRGQMMPTAQGGLQTSAASGQIVAITPVL